MLIESILEWRAPLLDNQSDDLILYHVILNGRLATVVNSNSCNVVLENSFNEQQVQLCHGYVDQIMIELFEHNTNKGNQITAFESAVTHRCCLFACLWLPLLFLGMEVRHAVNLIKIRLRERWQPISN